MTSHTHEDAQAPTINPDSLTARLALLQLADTSLDDDIWPYLGSVVAAWCDVCIGDFLQHVAVDSAITAQALAPEGADSAAVIEMLNDYVIEMEAET